MLKYDFINVSNSLVYEEKNMKLNKRDMVESLLIFSPHQ